MIALPVTGHFVWSLTEEAVTAAVLGLTIWLSLEVDGLLTEGAGQLLQPPAITEPFDTKSNAAAISSGRILVFIGILL